MALLENYAPPVTKTKSKYADDVAQLADAIKSGKGQYWGIGPFKGEQTEGGVWEYPEAAAEIAKFQAAAREANYSASVVERKVDNSKHTVTVVLTLGERRTRATSDKGDSVEGDAAEAS